jgi:hypothetical protein
MVAVIGLDSHIGPGWVRRAGIHVSANCCKLNLHCVAEEV